MDNASKALYMAGALLIALLVISLLVYAFTNIGKVQDQKDKIESEEEITSFNTEYESFNKSIMYGVDVISCINKVINHNEKYVKGKNAKETRYYNIKYGDEGIIQVELELNKNELNESIDIYHFDANHKVKRYNNLSGMKKEIKEKTLRSIIETEKITLYDDKISTDILDLSLETIAADKGWEVPNTLKNSKLIDMSNKKFYDDGLTLYNLAKYAYEIEIAIENSDVKSNREVNGWTYIKYSTCFADLKKRKFKCSDIKYSSTTGMVNYLKFSEIK